MSFYSRLYLVVIIFIIFPHNINSQYVLFKSCTKAPNLSESYLCENEKMAQFVEKSMLDACKHYNRVFKNSEIHLSFGISEKGEINNLELKEYGESKVHTTPIYIKDSIIHDFNKLTGDKLWFTEYHCSVRLPIANNGAPISKIVDRKSIEIILPNRDIFKVVSEYPRFPGCEDLSTNEEKKDCAMKKYSKYIESNLIYPANAKKNGVQGDVEVGYIIEVDGSISNIEIVRKLNDECDQAAIDVIKSMNNFTKKWIPGMWRNRIVRVWLKTPINFKL